MSKIKICENLSKSIKICENLSKFAKIWQSLATYAKIVKICQILKKYVPKNIC